MKNKLLKKLLIGGSSLAGITALVAPLTSCSCSKDKGEKFGVSVVGYGTSIDNTKATKGKEYKGTITSAYEIITVRSVVVSGINVPLNYFNFKISADKMSCSIGISKYAVEGDLVINVITRFQSGEYYVNLTDDLDNTGFYCEEPWITQDDMQSGFDLNFWSVYPIALDYPDPLGHWTMWVHVYCNGSEIPYGTNYWTIEASSDYSNYTMSFSPSVVTGDLTIEVGRLATVFGTGKHKKEMFYFNQDYKDLEGVTGFSFIRGTKANIVAYYAGEQTDNKIIKFNGFKVYIDRYELPKEYYTWVEDTEGDYPLCILTIDSDAVLGDIYIDADITVIG